MQSILIVKSVQVPWQLESVSDPEIIEESGRCVKVRILVYFGSHGFEDDLKTHGFQSKDDNIPDEIWNKLGYRIAEITFSEVRNYEILNPDSFHRKRQLFGFQVEFLEPLLQNYDPNTYEQNCEAQWRTTKICPDPSFYEILNSSLIKGGASTQSKLKHWIISGHDVLLSIVAAKFEIELVDK